MDIPGVDQILGMLGLDAAARKERAVHKRALLRFSRECIDYANEAWREMSAHRSFKWNNAGVVVTPPARPQAPEGSRDHLDGFRRVEAACEAVRETWGRWLTWAVHKATPDERADAGLGQTAVGEIIAARNALLSAVSWCANSAPWSQRLKRQDVLDEVANAGEPDLADVSFAKRPPPTGTNYGGI
jgi:hypothetical protein